MHPNHPINRSVPANKLLDKQTNGNKGTRNFTARQGIYTIIQKDTNTIQKHKSLDRIVFFGSHPHQESLQKYSVTTSKHKQECWSHLAVGQSGAFWSYWSYWHCQWPYNHRNQWPQNVTTVSPTLVLIICLGSYQQYLNTIALYTYGVAMSLTTMC